MIDKSDLIVSLYQRGMSSHELRLTRIDDSEHNLSDSHGKIENGYLQLRRSELLEAGVHPDFETHRILVDLDELVRDLWPREPAVRAV